MSALKFDTIEAASESLFFITTALSTGDAIVI